MLGDKIRVLLLVALLIWFLLPEARAGSTISSMSEGRVSAPSNGRIESPQFGDEASYQGRRAPAELDCDERLREAKLAEQAYETARLGVEAQNILAGFGARAFARMETLNAALAAESAHLRLMHRRERVTACAMRE